MSVLCRALVVCGGLWCLDSISAAGAGSHRNSVALLSTERGEQTSTSPMLDPVAMCSAVKCKRGRECRVLSSGIPDCVCRRKCPSKSKARKRRRRKGKRGRKKRRRVCGSDGTLYESHCELHREACVRGIHLRALRGSDAAKCREDPLAALKTAIRRAEDEVHLYEEEHIRVPASCHQNERDRMREFLVSWMTLTAAKRKWYKQGMSYERMMELHFAEADYDGSGRLEAAEWLEYLHKNKTYHSDAERDAVDKQRLLCLDALVEEGDLDEDYRLRLGEFSRLMAAEFVPSNKLCFMDNRRYEDGTKTKVDCNGW